MIQYIPNKEIDKQAYDACIAGSPNELVYAYSWYLDCVAPGWALLVRDDYEMVMPLPTRQKFGIQYVFTPLFAQQLGIFGEGINSRVAEDFLEKIPAKYRLIDLKFNEYNYFLENTKGFTSRTNYLLDLESDYAQTCKKYNRNCRRRLQKAEDAGLSIDPSFSAREFARFIGKNLEDQVSELNRKGIDILEKVTHEGLRRERCEVVAAIGQEGVQGMGSFFFSNDRLIFSVVASNKNGKKN